MLSPTPRKRPPTPGRTVLPQTPKSGVSQLLVNLSLLDASPLHAPAASAGGGGSAPRGRMRCVSFVGVA
ncbi:hypothetical protein FOA52_006564 [Chlamydomonas sp. UWO 241]|nr:hypothetical protein FOA52_006564 [Chlamydomonas sp. UWO 241]